MHGESSQVGNDARLPPCVHFPTRIGQDCWDSLGTVLSENVMTVSLSPPSDLPSPNVDVLDFGLSDHCLLRWSTQTYRPAPVFTTSTRRCWRSFDQDTFRSDLLASVLCDPQVFTDLDCLDCDSFASLYDSTISELLNRQVPVRSVSCRQRPSSKWFDDDCRTAKLSTFLIIIIIIINPRTCRLQTPELRQPKRDRRLKEQQQLKATTRHAASTSSSTLHSAAPLPVTVVPPPTPAAAAATSTVQPW